MVEVSMGKRNEPVVSLLDHGSVVLVDDRLDLLVALAGVVGHEANGGERQAEVRTDTRKDRHQSGL